MGNQSKQSGNPQDPSVPGAENQNQAHHQRGTQPRGGQRKNAEAPGHHIARLQPKKTLQHLFLNTPHLWGHPRVRTKKRTRAALALTLPHLTRAHKTQPPPRHYLGIIPKKAKESKPNKAEGRDFTNNYTLHISSPPIQQFVWRVCNRYLHQPLPEKWLEAGIILLLKKGDIMTPVNYSPIALLNGVYKITAKHTNRELLAAAINHSILHPDQFGRLPNCKCQDHIFNLLSKFRESASSYSLYIDFIKEFNPVPHTALFTVLTRLNFPTPLVSLIQSLYRAPRDFLVVSGHTHPSHLQARGVRQGSPMLLILFCLYFNVQPVLGFSAHPPGVLAAEKKTKKKTHSQEK